MNATSDTDIQQSLDQFRHLLLHLQMQCGSIHEILRFFNEEDTMEHFEALKTIDPKLMPQLMAREFVLEARKTANPGQAVEHLEKALQLDPDCAEACLEMAAQCTSAEAAMMWYQRSMDAAMNTMGESRFAELTCAATQDPWQQAELQTFLLAKLNLAENLFNEGYFESSATHLRELINWDPSNTLQLHQYLMVCLLCENNLKEAFRLRRAYGNDFSAVWYYCRVFLRFKMEGDTRRTRNLLMRAYRRNLWVPLYLLGIREMPSPESGITFKSLHVKVPCEEDDQDACSPELQAGSRFEATECVTCIAPAFQKDPTLVNWVRQHMPRL